MPNNFHYASYSYLDEWMATDCPFHKILASKETDATSLAAGADCLVGIAKKYSVIRTLRNVELKDVKILQPAYDLLNQVECPTEADVISKVIDFAEALGKTYGSGSIPLSAASKFLWMKFRSPVIIYDSEAANWLKPAKSGYSSYCERWRSEYRQVSDAIEAACIDLTGVKKFTLAWRGEDQTFSEWISSRWFRERVFDHYMLNATIFNKLDLGCSGTK